MKKLGLLLLLSVIVLALAPACSKSDSKLMQVVAEMNELCLQKVPMVGEVTEFTVDDNNLTIVCSVTNKDITYDLMSKSVDQVREQLKQTIANLSSNKLIDILREGDTGICYRYLWPDDQKLDIVYPFAEVEALASGVSE